MKMDQSHKIIEGMHYVTGRMIRVGLMNGLIHSITEVDDMKQAGRGSREGMNLLAPGLVDLQVNGYGGVDFNAPGLAGEEVEKTLLQLAKLGVCTVYPTLITGPVERISASLKILATLMDGGHDAASIFGGIHLEGPFISKEDGPRGAHPREHCRLPDADLVKRWQEEARGGIRIMTLAPELPGCAELIRTCRDLDMVVAIGHTAASGEDIRRAADAGATLSTHLGNGAHAVLPRHPNYIWEQLAEERLYASMIADGFHLGDAVLKVFSRSKGKKAILVSDSMTYAGLAPGIYDSPAAGSVRLTPEGKLHLLANPNTLAGSASNLPQGVGRMAALLGLSEAWDMASVHPSRLMHPHLPAGLSVGAPADLVLFRPNGSAHTINSVYKGGKILEDSKQAL